MPVIAQGLDYSARRLSGASIRAAGYQFVVRYLNFPGQIYPALNAAETADLTANGVEVHGVYEQNTNDPAGGYAAGRRLAAQAVASATAANLPPGRTIFMCADAWLYTHGIPVSTAMAFLDGARDIIGSSHYVLGAYGFADFVYAAQDGGHADRFWLCGAESGVRAGIHLYQWNNGYVTVDGLSCDLNKQYLPLIAGGSGGGATGSDPMAELIIKNKDGDDHYLFGSSVQGWGLRHIDSLVELRALKEAGTKVQEWTPADIVSVPVRHPEADAVWEDGRGAQVRAALGALSVKVDAGFGELRNDEANIIAAVRAMPTGTPDIPAFVSALVPALVPALPKGVTAEQIHTLLVDTLNNVRLTTGGN